MAEDERVHQTKEAVPASDVSLFDRPTLPIPPQDERPTSGPMGKPKRAGRRNLRQAVILLTRKLEDMGVDCSDVTELLGDE